jgi:hypothetical protein
VKRRHAVAGAVMIAAFVLGLAVAWKQLRVAQARALHAAGPAQPTPR